MILTVILDWDYNNFDVVDDDGDVICIYDDSTIGNDYIYIEGWLWCGKGYTERALYQSMGSGCEFKRVVEVRHKEGENESKRANKDSF